MSRLYVLDADRKPVPCDDVEAWVRWFEKGDRCVARDGDPALVWDVSTVFLGIDHSFREGPPILYETMVFGGPLNEESVRYSTEADALVGHAAMLARVRGASPPAAPFATGLPPGPWCVESDEEEGVHLVLDAMGSVLFRTKARALAERVLAFPDLVAAAADGLAILSAEFGHHHVAEPERKRLRDALAKARGGAS